MSNHRVSSDGVELADCDTCRRTYAAKNLTRVDNLNNGNPGELCDKCRRAFERHGMEVSGGA